MQKSRTSKTPAPWPIKSVSMDTRTALKKAAKKQGKTLGEYFNTDIREYAQSIISSKPKPPMKIEEIANDVEELKQENKELRQQLGEVMTIIRERPSTLKEFVFGKKAIAVEKKK